MSWVAIGTVFCPSFEDHQFDKSFPASRTLPQRLLIRTLCSKKQIAIVDHHLIGPLCFSKLIQPSQHIPTRQETCSWPKKYQQNPLFFLGAFGGPPFHYLPGGCPTELLSGRWVLAPNLDKAEHQGLKPRWGTSWYGSLAHALQGFMHVRWFFGTFFHQQYESGCWCKNRESLWEERWFSPSHFPHDI